MTTKQAYNDFLTALVPVYERREAAHITDWVFENATGLNRLERSQHQDIGLSAAITRLLENYAKQLLQHKPVQYVLHEAWFCKMKFFVNEHVLIPRPETEELVQWIVDDFRQARPRETAGLPLLEVGTGSGCIAIAIKKQLQEIQVSSLDISVEALTVARKNADLLQAQVHFLQSDFLDEAGWITLGTFAVIVSNPPYIPCRERETLANNVLLFEPGAALFVPDDSPLVFYEKIAAFSRSHLIPNGNVYVEVHENYAEQVLRILSDCGFRAEMRKDLHGKDRMIKASLSASAP